jgi:peptidoglycan/LPS O-acetylase OafA/YrhL
LFSRVWRHEIFPPWCVHCGALTVSTVAIIAVSGFVLTTQIHSYWDDSDDTRTVIDSLRRRCRKIYIAHYGVALRCVANALYADDTAFYNPSQCPHKRKQSICFVGTCILMSGMSGTSPKSVCYRHTKYMIIVSD